MTGATLVCVGYLFLPAESVAATCVYNGLGLVSFLMILVGVRRHRPVNGWAWYVFSAGVAAFVVGDIIYEVSGLVLGRHPYPFYDDAVYFAAYPMIWIGLLFAVRGRSRRDSASLIDAAVIATGVGLVYWVFVIGPALADQASPVFERLVTVGYPTCDVLMCAVLTRLLTLDGARTASLVQLACGAALTFICDVIWTVNSAFSSYAGGIVNAGFLLGYVLWAGAALHPSMLVPGGESRAGRSTFGRGRFVLLAGCSLLVPGVLFVEGSRHEAVSWAAVGVGSVVLFLLVLGRMAGFVGQIQEQTAQLEVLALHDELTGLPNRRRFEQRLGEAMASGSAQVCLLDLNGFKVINDRFGHAVGDRVLVAVAERLTGLVRDTDLVARMGGDEFAVLLTDATDDEGDSVVARLGAEMRRPLEVGTHELLVGASIGVAGTGGTLDPVEVQRCADVAMYAAKTTGARSRRYVVELDDQAGEESRLGAEMRTALDTGQFRMVYQPIVSLPDGRTRYVESLIRWQHPERGFVSPIDFIPVAEHNGLIVELGEWILRTACARFVGWQASHGAAAPVRISVNVSARQLAEPGFAQVVADVLAETGMLPEQLIVEVTETAVFGGGVAVRAVEDIHDLGVGIALDDFGTGHSSLGLLQTVPVDILKVDKSFVDKVTMAGRHAVIATALIQVSNGLGLSAVAEGVESAEQAVELHRLGYRYAQGYHFGRPVPEPDFAGTATRVEIAAAG